MKEYFIVVLVFPKFFVMAFLPGPATAQRPIYLNLSYSFREHATDMVSRMTIEEKQSQLGDTMPSTPCLGIGKYDVWREAQHGVMGRNDNSSMTAKH